MSEDEMRDMLWEFEEYKDKMKNVYERCTNLIKGNYENPRPMSLLIDGFIMEQIKNNNYAAKLDEMIDEEGNLLNIPVVVPKGTLPFEFIEWYSGMEGIKIENAYNRWIKEKK